MLILKTLIISGMHLRITYTNNNFQQNRVSRSVKTVELHTNLFAKNLKLYKFATTSSNFEKYDYFRHTSSYNVHLYQFQQNRVSKSVKTVHTNLFAKNIKLYKL